MKLNIASTRVVKMYFLCFSWHDTFGVTVLLRYRKDMQRHSEIQQKFLWCCLVPQTTLCCQETASAGEEKYSTNTMRTEEASHEDMSLSRRELETRRCLGGVHGKKKKKMREYIFAFTFDINFMSWQHCASVLLGLGLGKTLGRGEEEMMFWLFWFRRHKSSWKISQRLVKNLWCCHASRCWDTMSKSGVLLGNHLTQL